MAEILYLICSELFTWELSFTSIQKKITKLKRKKKHSGVFSFFFLTALWVYLAFLAQYLNCRLTGFFTTLSCCSKFFLKKMFTIRCFWLNTNLFSLNENIVRYHINMFYWMWIYFERKKIYFDINKYILIE